MKEFWICNKCTRPLNCILILDERDERYLKNKPSRCPFSGKKIETTWWREMEPLEKEVHRVEIEEILDDE